MPFEVVRLTGHTLAVTGRGVLSTLADGLLSQRRLQHRHLPRRAVVEGVAVHHKGMPSRLGSGGGSRTVTASTEDGQRLIFRVRNAPPGRVTDIHSVFSTYRQATPRCCI